jgi:hypothetical protein
MVELLVAGLETAVADAHPAGLGRIPAAPAEGQELERLLEEH